MRGSRARRFAVLVVSAVAAASFAGMSAATASPGPSAGRAAPVTDPVTAPAGPAAGGAVTRAVGNGLRGRAVPAQAGPPRRSCATPSAGRFGCQAVSRSVENAPLASAGTPYGLSPADLQSAYALPGATAGTGQEVWIVDAYDNPRAEADLAVYRKQYGLPACTTANGCFRKLNQRGVAGPYPAPDSGWAGEISLDLQMVSAVCPNCRITLVEADDNGSGLFAAVKMAISAGARFVSLSWGGPESGSEPYWDRYLAGKGVVITAASGDDAYAYGVIYPATSPSVVSVGGTSLRPAANARGWAETAWSLTSGHGAGSGCSSSEARPAWQTVPSASVCTTRATSDVSAVADPATGVAVYHTYGGSGWSVFGGTSAAAPIVAAVYALAGTPATDTPQAYPYAHPEALNDITSGSTGSCVPSVLCTATAGWDGPTGLGSPRGVTAFAATPPPVTISDPGRQSGRVNSPATLQLLGSDVDGLALQWSAVGLPPGLVLDPVTGLVVGTPTAFGTFAVTVTATNTQGESNSHGFVWQVASDDTTPPTAALTGPKAPVAGTTAATVSWTGADAYTGIAYFQVRYRKASYAGGFGSWTVPSGWTRLTSTSLTQRSLAPGYTYCWSVRAVDRAGNVSPWSGQRCTAVPLDDRALAASAGWTRGTGTAFYTGTSTGASTSGRTLARAGAQVRRIAVLATRCPSCGVVGVYVGGTLVGRVNLYGTLHYRTLYSLPVFGYRTGTVVLKVLSTGKRVAVDAVAISRV